MHQKRTVSLEPRHDFAAKLGQSAMWPTVRTYIAWQRALRTNSGERTPPPNSAPLSINLDLTTACNFQCDHCIDYEALNGREHWDHPRLLRVLDHMINQGLRSVILIGGGEPTLYPKFIEVVRFLKERQVQVAVVSNGSRNQVIRDAAEYFTKGDWARLSLDSGVEDTFFRMHKPKREITLREICSWVPEIRNRNRELLVGFSFIITWKGAARKGEVKIVSNKDEIVQAAELAKSHGFHYISFKPFLTRHETGSEIMKPAAMEEFDATVESIREAVSRAKALETDDFRVVESTNLRVLFSGTWREFTCQPRTCHMIALRQVLSPLGTFNCPAHRGDSRARIGDPYLHLPERSEDAKVALGDHVAAFDASRECSEVTCLYQPTNWWLEKMIESSDEPRFEQLSEYDSFL